MQRDRRLRVLRPMPNLVKRKKENRVFTMLFFVSADATSRRRCTMFR